MIRNEWKTKCDRELVSYVSEAFGTCHAVTGRMTCCNGSVVRDFFWWTMAFERHHAKTQPREVISGDLRGQVCGPQRQIQRLA